MRNGWERRRRVLSGQAGGPTDTRPSGRRVCVEQRQRPVGFDDRGGFSPRGSPGKRNGKSGKRKTPKRAERVASVRMEGGAYVENREAARQGCQMQKEWEGNGKTRSTNQPAALPPLRCQISNRTREPGDREQRLSRCGRPALCHRATEIAARVTHHGAATRASRVFTCRSRRLLSVRSRCSQVAVRQAATSGSPKIANLSVRPRDWRAPASPSPLPPVPRRERKGGVRRERAQ